VLYGGCEHVSTAFLIARVLFLGYATVGKAMATFFIHFSVFESEVMVEHVCKYGADFGFFPKRSSICMNVFEVES
jgi:hypothetical protein